MLALFITHCNKENKKDLPQVTEGVSITEYTCPMHPQIRRNEPGKCPICGMDLMPVKKEETSFTATSPAESILSGMKTDKFSKIKKGEIISAYGKIEVPEDNKIKIPAHFNSRILEVFVKRKGETVKKGQVIATLYSEELPSLQKSLQVALKNSDKDSTLYLSLKKLLKDKYGLHEEFIKKMETSPSPIYTHQLTAPVDGVITAINVQKGDHASMETVVCEIADLSRVLATVYLYEDEIVDIQKGINVVVSPSAGKALRFTGRVREILKELDEKGRVVKVIIELQNRGLRLLPEMPVIVQIQKQEREIWAVPVSALLWAGNTSYLYVKKDGRFELRRVITGKNCDNYIEIISGISPGEEFVSDGAYLLDAYNQLKGNPNFVEELGSKTDGEMMHESGKSHHHHHH